MSQPVQSILNAKAVRSDLFSISVDPSYIGNRCMMLNLGMYN